MPQQQQSAPDRLDINGNPVAPDRLDIHGNPIYVQSDKTPNEVDPNTVGTLVQHLGQQVNPMGLIHLAAQALQHPIDTTVAIGSQQGAMFDEAKAAYEQGDYPKAAARFVEYLIPLVGPRLARSGDLFQAHKWAAGAGDALGIGLSLFGPQALANVAAARYPLAANPAPPVPATARNAPIQFAQERGVPLSAADVSDNSAVRGVQAMADRTLGGSLIATPARAAQAARMGQVSEDIANTVYPTAMTPETAGLSVARQLGEKVKGHQTAASEQYNTIAALEQQPGNRMAMPLKPQPVDALADSEIGQLRRIVHELDAAPYTPRLLRPSGVGGSLEHVEGTGGAGAQVFNDIVERMPGTSTPTRAVVQNQLEAYIAGGPETNIVKAAREVAAARGKAQGGSVVSKPELPPSAMDVPTRLEATRVNSEEMGFPVDLTEPKRLLRPVYDQMKRQMPITQQQSSYGLKAIENILNSPDYGPLSQIDQDLSAIKAVAREHGGLAKMAVKNLEAAVMKAAENGGPDVVDALKKGRAETIAKYGASDVLDTLSKGPVKDITSLTAPKDAAILDLRAIAEQVPEKVPEIARAYLEDLLAKPNQVAEWSKLGPSTRKILFPEAGQSQALDQFFALKQRISAGNSVNPSGSGHQALLGGQLMMIPYDPLHALEIQLTGATLAKLLRSKAAVDALTRGLSLSDTAPAAVRTAATLNLIRTAKQAGVSLELPKAADQQPSR